MATRRPVVCWSHRLQASKLLAIVVGLLVVFGGGSGLRSEPSPAVDPLVLLTVVGLGLAGVVILEAAATVGRLLAHADSAVDEPTRYLAVRVLELSVAGCAVAGVWQLQPFSGSTLPEALAVVAAGMIAVSFVRSTIALRRRTAETTASP